MVRFLFSSLLWTAVILDWSVANPVRSAVDTSAPQLDEQLYSRQIFVYGKSAQQSLSSSHVVISGSNKPLAAEIVKNLALAGVGRLTIVDNSPEATDDTIRDPKQLLCGSDSLAQYALSLNPLISVLHCALDGFTVACSNRLTFMQNNR